MARHHEKLIERAQAAQADSGLPDRYNDPMTRQQIESFVKGFGLSTAAAQRVIDRWIDDQRIAHRDGYNDGYNDAEGY